MLTDFNIDFRNDSSLTHLQSGCTLHALFDNGKTALQPTRVSSELTDVSGLIHDFTHFHSFLDLGYLRRHTNCRNALILAHTQRHSLWLAIMSTLQHRQVGQQNLTTRRPIEFWLSRTHQYEPAALMLSAANAPIDASSLAFLLLNISSVQMSAVLSRVITPLHTPWLS